MVRTTDRITSALWNWMTLNAACGGSAVSISAHVIAHCGKIVLAGHEGIQNLRKLRAQSSPDPCQCGGEIDCPDIDSIKLDEMSETGERTNH